MLHRKVDETLAGHQLAVVVVQRQLELGDACVGVADLLNVGFGQLGDFLGPVQQLVHPEDPSSVGGDQDALAGRVRAAGLTEKFLKSIFIFVNVLK